MSGIIDTMILFAEDIPEYTKLAIEKYDDALPPKYVLRLTYTSKTSGRTMCQVAKGDRLPTTHDALYYFYLRQIVLTPTEVAREFSTLYFRERRAKQDAFLAGDRSVTVSDKTARKDKLSYEGYA